MRTSTRLARRLSIRFGLKALFLAVTVVALMCADISRYVSSCRLQGRIANDLAARGASFRYDAWHGPWYLRPFREYLSIFSVPSDVDARSPFTDDDVQALANLTGLRYVTLSQITGRATRLLLTDRPRLWYLHLSFVDNESLAALCELPMLHVLRLDVAAPEPGGPTLDLESLRLERLTDLECLQLNGAGVTDSAVPPCVRLRHLRELDLCGSAIDDDAVPLLLRLRWLRALDVRDTAVTKLGAKRLFQYLAAETSYAYE